MRPAAETATCRRITAALIEALMETDGVDYVSVWWAARCASALARSDLRIALGEAFSLAEAMGLLEAPVEGRSALVVGAVPIAPPDEAEALLN